MTSNPSEIQAKPVALFAVHALALALLLGFWPTPRVLYLPFVYAQAHVIYGGEAGVALRPAPPDRYDARDTVMEGLDRDGNEPRWRARFDLLNMGYWPSAALLALLLATPMRARRRLLGVAAGLLWIDALALGRIGVEILRATAEVESGVPGAPDAVNTNFTLAPGDILFIVTTGAVEV